MIVQLYVFKYCIFITKFRHRLQISFTIDDNLSAIGSIYWFPAENCRCILFVPWHAHLYTLSSTRKKYDEFMLWTSMYICMGNANVNNSLQIQSRTKARAIALHLCTVNDKFYWIRLHCHCMACSGCKIQFIYCAMFPRDNMSITHVFYGGFHLNGSQHWTNVTVLHKAVGNSVGITMLSTRWWFELLTYAMLLWFSVCALRYFNFTD